MFRDGNGDPKLLQVLGPYQDAWSPYSGVLAKFITSMLREEPPTIVGDGQQSRDFTYIDNDFQVNLLAATAPAEKASGRVLNVAACEAISLLQIANDFGRRLATAGL